MEFPSIFPKFPPEIPSVFGFDTTKLAPAPLPFLPVPRGLIIQKEGLEEWVAYGVQGQELVDLGTVVGADEDEALEAAERAGKNAGGGFSAFQVVEA
jgi:hypothetical protein